MYIHEDMHKLCNVGVTTFLSIAEVNVDFRKLIICMLSFFRFIIRNIMSSEKRSRVQGNQSILDKCQQKPLLNCYLIIACPSCANLLLAAGHAKYCRQKKNSNGERLTYLKKKCRKTD